MDNPQEFLTQRIEYLEYEAKSYYNSITASQGVGLTAMLIGMFASANPVIGAIGLLLGGGSYGYSVFRDKVHTDRFCFLPGSRGELFTQMAGLNHHKEDYEAFEDVTSCLTPIEASEYLMVLIGDEFLSNFLSIFSDSTERFNQYKKLLRTYHSDRLKGDGDEGLNMFLTFEQYGLLPDDEPVTQERLPCIENYEPVALFESVIEVDSQTIPNFSETDFTASTWGLPEEDLAATLAQTTVDPSLAESTLIACPKGTGKSNLLRAAIHKAHQLHKGKADIFVFSGKDGESYCGIERSKNYLYSGDRKTSETVVHAMHCLEGRLVSYVGKPTITVMDEYNNTLAAAEMFDQSQRPKGNTQQMMSMLTYERVTKGRSKLVCDWITSHSPYVQDIKLNTAIQQSLGIVILARGNKFGAINDALTGKRQIIDDSLIREQLLEQYQRYRQHNPADYNTVVALTNLLGDWRLVTLPKYPDEQPEIVKQPLPVESQDTTQPRVYTPKNLTRDDAIWAIELAKLAGTTTATGIKELIWGVKRGGGSKAWEAACREYDDLIGSV